MTTCLSQEIHWMKMEAQAYSPRKSTYQKAKFKRNFILLQTIFNGDQVIGNALINFQSCSFNSKGNLELIGQNVRFFLQHTSSQQGSVTWKIWQPYGYSFYELNTDLEIIKSDYEEAFYTNRTVRDGHKIGRAHV